MSETGSFGATGWLRRQHAEVRDTLRAANAQAALYWQNPDRRTDRQLIVILLVAALCLLLMDYLVINAATGLPGLLWALGMQQAARDLYATFAEPVNGPFILLTGWTGGMILCLFVLPALAMRAMDMRLRDHGMRLGHRVDGPVYGLLFAFMVPVVLVSAMTPGFREFYPLWRPVEGEPLWPRFFVWEAAYMAQFVAVEFFFRGVLIHAARPRFGAYAILLPMIPYMMVHFGKPAGEAAASVVAGLVLGYLSLRTGSIAYGVLLHGGVALTMDLTALWLQGRLF